MGTYPLNLTLRFLLELAALGAAGAWAWRLGDGWVRYALAIGIPLLMAVVWGTFAVPDDPSRSGAAPVAVPGMVRLAIELAFFAFATWSLQQCGHTRAAWAMGILVVFHYLISYDRLQWLMAH
jgi:hypothetical protein